MKNRLKVYIKIYFLFFFLKKQLWSYEFTSKSWFKFKQKSGKLKKTLQVYMKIDKSNITLMQKVDLNKNKVENYKLKRVIQKN